MDTKDKCKRYKLRGKPKCLACNNPLTFVYDDAVKGHICQKCSKCKNVYVINLENLEVSKID